MDIIIGTVIVILVAVTFALIPERLLWITGALRRVLRMPWHSREFVESLKLAVPQPRSHLQVLRAGPGMR